MANYTVGQVVGANDSDVAIIVGTSKDDPTKEKALVFGPTGAAAWADLAYREPADYDAEGAGGTWRVSTDAAPAAPAPEEPAPVEEPPVETPPTPDE